MPIKNCFSLLLFAVQQVIKKREGKVLAMAGDGEEVRNKQVLARDYIDGNPNETDMYFSTSSISLKVPEGSKEVFGEEPLLVL